MRGFLLLLIMITIVMLGLAGCPKKDAGAGGATPPTPAGGAAGGDAAGGDSATDGGE